MEEGIKARDQDRPSYLRVYLIIFAASVLHISTGGVLGWTSPILRKLNLTTDEQSLVGSLYALGAAPGPFVTTFGLDTIGRKGTLYVVWSFFMTSWIILAISHNINIIYIGRLIGGLGVGGAISGMPVYVAEVALPEIRGSLASMSLLALGLGTIIMSVCGPYTTYTSLTLCGLAMTAIFCVFFYFVPESPYYYCRKGQKKEAEEAIRKLRGYKTYEKVEEELDQVEKAIFFGKESSSSFSNLLLALKQPVPRKTLVLSFFLITVQQFQGVYALQTFNQLIFENAQLNIPASTVELIYFIAGMVFLIVPVLVVNKLFGIKTSYIISGFGTSISLFLLGVYFYLINSVGVDMHDYSYISVLFLVLSSLFGHLGLSPLSWAIIVEILPLPIKGIGTGICGCATCLIAFVFLTIFPIIAENYGLSTDFFGFSALLFISTIIAIFIIPDTTGKTLREIQELLVEK